MPSVAVEWFVHVGASRARLSTMVAEQSLVGAMGCASWRAHWRLDEHAAVAPSGGMARARSGSPVFGSVGAVDLNEVGVTDLVMATLWRCGPTAASYAVSASVETNHLGADIAILHRRSRRIAVYQAKVAWLDRPNSTAFRLKSKVTKSQVNLLHRPQVTVQGVQYRVTGRLALYQADDRTFLRKHCGCCDCALWLLASRWWPVRHMSPRADPQIGREYYENVLACCGCSPSGVLAAPVPPRGSSVTAVALATTWPWEFDVFEWFRATDRDRTGSPLDNGEAPGDRYREFDQYEPTSDQRLDAEETQQLVDELVEQLKLPASQRLSLIVLP